MPSRSAENGTQLRQQTHNILGKNACNIKCSTVDEILKIQKKTKQSITTKSRLDDVKYNDRLCNYMYLSKTSLFAVKPQIYVPMRVLINYSYIYARYLNAAPRILVHLSVISYYFL